MSDYVYCVDDVETLKTEKEELIMKLKTQVEEQSQNEKQIITGQQGWGQVHWYLYLSALKYNLWSTCTCT